MKFVSSVLPTFVKPLKDISIINGKMLKQDVVVSGIPKPVVHWFKDDEPLSEKDFIFDCKDKTHSISVEQSNPSNTGKYKAIAENPAGKVESLATVEIQTKPVIRKPDDVKIVSGSEFSLSVLVEGRPEPKLKWMKDKTELPASLGITIEKKEDNYVLFMKESTISLNGTYSLNASNPAGNDTETFKVVVLGKSDLLLSQTLRE